MPLWFAPPKKKTHTREMHLLRRFTVGNGRTREMQLLRRLTVGNGRTRCYFPAELYLLFMMD